MDHFSRVSPAIEADVSLTGQRVVAVLDRLAQTQQVPKEICVDNGPKFIRMFASAVRWTSGCIGTG